jgi:hypothetical protein
MSNENLTRRPSRSSGGPGAPRAIRMVVAGTALFVLAGCGPEEPAAPPPTAEEEREFQGLTPEEIQQQAEPMTLEEAERLGIIDTTIRIESPIHPDSVVHLEEGQILPPTPPETLPPE